MDLADLRARLASPGSRATEPTSAEKIAPQATSDDAIDLVTAPLIPAAVLVPIVHGPAAAVLLTRRTETLRRHAGQVSFPGGRIDPGDTGPEAAALRETQEELGLDPATIELVGRLPAHVTGTGFRIDPILGLLAAGFRTTLAPDEVAEVFELPLSVVLDPDAPTRRRAHYRGRWREFWVWPHPTQYIWGATAAILVSLAHKLRAG